MGVATALSALSVFLLVRDPPRLSGNSDHGFFSGIADVLKIRSLWPLLPITGVSYAVVLAERGLWAGPFFSSVYGLDPVARGHALLVMAAAMSAGAILYGPLDRMLGTRKWIVFGGASATALCFALLGLGDLPLWAAILVMGLLGGFGMTYGVLMAHGRSFVPDHLLGAASPCSTCCSSAAPGCCSPSPRDDDGDAGKAAGRAYAILHLMFAALVLAALIIYLFARDNPPKG